MLFFFGGDTVLSCQTSTTSLLRCIRFRKRSSVPLASQHCNRHLHLSHTMTRENDRAALCSALKVRACRSDNAYGARCPVSSRRVRCCAGAHLFRLHNMKSRPFKPSQTRESDPLYLQLLVPLVTHRKGEQAHPTKSPIVPNRITYHT